MAITPMKLVAIVGPLDQFDTVVRGCIINREFHPEPATQVLQKLKYLYPFEQDNPYTDLLHRVEDMAERIGIGLDYADFGDMSLSPQALSGYLEETQARFSALEEEQMRLNRLIVENEQIVLQLKHVRDVNVELSEFFTFTYVKFRFGYMPRETYDSFLPILQKRDDVYFFPTSTERNVVYGMYMTARTSSEQVDALFTSLRFERVRISSRVHGTGESAIVSMVEESRQAKLRIQAIDVELAALRASERRNFLAHYSYIRFMNDTFNLRRYAAHTEESFYMLGWVPDNEYEATMKRLARHEDLNCVTVSDDPEVLSDYVPPIKLKNHRLFRAFEPFVAMYGLPAYNEIDPTPLMTLTYTLMFGVMFGDVGQGALLVLLGFLMWKLKGMWLGKIVGYAGVSSVVFGFVYGSVFGNEHLLPGFKVLESSASNQRILMITIYGGVALLTLAFGFNIFNGFRQKDLEKSIFGPNGLVGLLLYWAVIMVVLPFIGFGTQMLPMPVLIPAIVLPLLVVFMREPLSRLAARRKDWKPHGSIADFIMQNFFEMFEFLLSFVTNTISFLRVGAYAISHASMMMVVYSLAQGAGDSHNILGLILGNILVAGIEGLLVGIQVLRLEFYELFGRFYSGAGKPYVPIIIDYKSRED